MPVENHVVPRARPPGKNRIQQEGTKKCAGHSADGQRGDADAPDQQQPAGDGAEAVDQGRYCLYVELLAHQQYRAKDAAGKEA